MPVDVNVATFPVLAGGGKATTPSRSGARRSALRSATPAPDMTAPSHSLSCNGAKTARGAEAGAIKSTKPRKGCSPDGTLLAPVTLGAGVAEMHSRPWSIGGSQHVKVLNAHCAHRIDRESRLCAYASPRSRQCNSSFGTNRQRRRNFAYIIERLRARFSSGKCRFRARWTEATILRASKTHDHSGAIRRYIAPLRRRRGCGYQRYASCIGSADGPQSDLPLRSVSRSLRARAACSPPGGLAMLGGQEVESDSVVRLVAIDGQILTGQSSIDTVNMEGHFRRTD